MACDCAPGLRRTRWGFMGWAPFDRAVWDALVDEAAARFEAGLARVGGAAAVEASPDARPDANRVRFVGASTSSPSISRARDHVRRAGVRPIISIELCDAAGMKSFVNGHRALSHAHLSMVASNLDSRARLDAPAYVQADEQAFSAACRTVRDGSRFVALDAQDAGGRIGLDPTVRCKIGRGRVETLLEVFDGKPTNPIVVEIPDSAGGAPRAVEVFEAASEQFAARLRKVLKERKRAQQA